MIMREKEYNEKTKGDKFSISVHFNILDIFGKV